MHELAEWLKCHRHLDELRELVVDHWELLSGWLARQNDMRVVYLAAELGDDAARRRLQVWLARLRERAQAGEEHAQGFLADNPDWRQFRAEWTKRIELSPLSSLRLLTDLDLKGVPVTDIGFSIAGVHNRTSTHMRPGP
jgi:hypothetical protein